MQGKYLNNHWSSTKFCSAQFKGSHILSRNADTKKFRETIAHAKGYDDMTEHVAPWTGEEEFASIVAAIETRGGRRKVSSQTSTQTAAATATQSDKSEYFSQSSDTQQEFMEDPDAFKTPPLQTGIRDPKILNAPLAPSSDLRMHIPASVLQQDVPTPTPTPVP